MESLTSDDDVGAPRVSGASDDSQSESTHSSASPPAVASKSKRKMNVSATAQTSAPSVKPKRKRRKHELDHLRAVAAELEKKLQMLNRSSDQEQTSASHVWKHISYLQMTERQKAVGENGRLRELIREQVRSVKSMQRTLEKTPDLSKMGIATETMQDQLPAPKELYRELFKNITSSYTSGAGNLLLQQPCMPSPSLVGKRKVNMEMETIGECGPRMCLQFVESRLIPFSLLRIGDHAWDFLSATNGHENFQLVRADRSMLISSENLLLMFIAYIDRLFKTEAMNCLVIAQ
ncbi:Hypothetical protein PHPALM_20035 [Phytophthora palmivora]|uniref:Uncharacterized protein n=1 Tax=Phytophthora palmivora TaxID=4796 RepID=A0A2P4XFW4_9STRA|nr:Hypothetical protein PHPALM_20035 [Phytophthora palmivora]